jgi:hypothetical protein
MGPFLCIDGKNSSSLYSMMVDGRPADGYYASHFFPDRSFLNVNSKSTETDVSFCQYFSGQLEDGYKHGHGIEWMSNARIFIGDWVNGNKNMGKLYQVQKDSNY